MARRRALSRVSPETISFASSGSYCTETTEPCSSSLDANAGTPRFLIEQNRSGLRDEPLRGIFGIDPAFDGVAALREAGLREGQRLA